MRALLDAESELTRLRHKEKEVAAQISDDHILADELGKTMPSVFPNVHGELMKAQSYLFLHELILFYTFVYIFFSWNDAIKNQRRISRASAV